MAGCQSARFICMAALYIRGAVMDKEKGVAI